MSNAPRIAVIAVIAVVAFGAAYALAGDDAQDPDRLRTDVAAGPVSSTTETTGASTGSSSEQANACDVDDVVLAADAGYRVTVATRPDPPTPEDTTLEVLVERDGAPVSGATVCLSADMTEMSHTGVSRQADELGGGRYGMVVDFGMRGSWQGALLVVESDRGATSPVSFDVQ